MSLQTIKNNGSSVNQSGGSKLGSGAYGCVITPPVPCRRSTVKNLSTKKFVSKLIPEKLDKMGIQMINEEMSVYKILNKLDPKQEKFILPVDYCNLDEKDAIVSTRGRDDVKIVKFLKSSFKKGDYDYEFYTDARGKTKRYRDSDKFCPIDTRIKPLNIIFPYGGVSLDEMLTSRKWLQYRPYYRQYYPAIFRKLLIALDVLHRHHIVHCDIKQDNIICMPPKKNGEHWVYNDKLVRFIDFGFAYNVKKNYKDHLFYIEGTDIPLDIYVANYIHTYKQRHIREIIEDLRDENEFIGDIWNIDDVELVRSVISKLERKIKNREYADDFRRHMDGIAYKADIFSLGITFAICAAQLRINLTNELRDLLFNMLNVDPWARFNVEQCLGHKFFKN